MRFGSASDQPPKVMRPRPPRHPDEIKPDQRQHAEPEQDVQRRRQAVEFGDAGWPEQQRQPQHRPMPSQKVTPAISVRLAMVRHRCRRPNRSSSARFRGDQREAEREADRVAGEGSERRDPVGEPDGRAAGGDRVIAGQHQVAEAEDDAEDRDRDLAARGRGESGPHVGGIELAQDQPEHDDARSRTARSSHRADQPPARCEGGEKGSNACAPRRFGRVIRGPRRRGKAWSPRENPHPELVEGRGFSGADSPRPFDKLRVRSLMRTILRSYDRPLPLQLLAQHLEPEPFLLAGGAAGLQLRQHRRRLVVAGAVRA